MDQLTQAILKNYMKITNEQAQMTLLDEIHAICLKNIPTIGERIIKILEYLYDNEVVDEQWIMKWYKNRIQNKQISISEQEKSYYDNLIKFIDWLANAESDDEDDD